MLPLGRIGIDASELDDFNRGMVDHQKSRSTVNMLTMDEEQVDHLSEWVVDGQLNLSASGEVSRTMQLSMFDPGKAITFGPPHGIHFGRMVRVWKKLWIPAIGRPLEFPVFTGPVTHYDRTGNTISLECQGKEQRARTDVNTLVIKRNTHVVTAIRTILADRCGETRFSFPSTASVTARLPRDVTVGEDEAVWPWPVCLRLARTIGHQLFYDAMGTATLRVPSTVHPVFTFSSDDDLANITEPISIAHDVTDAYNRVKVKGKGSVVAIAQAPADHPLAPRTAPDRYSAGLGRNGVPYRRTLVVEAPTVASKSQAQAMADHDMQAQLALGNGATFSAVPVWHLDVRDPLRIDTQGYTGLYVLDEASIGLRSGQMSLGFHRVVHRRASPPRPKPKPRKKK